MANIAYVDGSYVNRNEGAVSIEDRGYQFSDGIYEYITFYNGTLLDGDLHLERMEHSLKELAIAAPMSMGALRIVIRELIERNGREHGGLYLQVTRGVARRDHVFPKNTPPVLTMTVSGPKLPKDYEINDGVKVITYPDLRWQRRDIKSVSLLANILAKQEAGKQKAREAWLIEGNSISEGAVSNAYIVTKGGEVVTHHADEHILGGITREVVLRLARKAGIAVAERAFNLVEMKNAAEAFLTSTSANVLPVTSIDGNPVGEGKPGKITKKLLELYTAHIFKETGWKA
jgi:D-alanine transaminase